MRRRKHRLVVEFTTSHPLTESKSAKGLALILAADVDLQANPIWSGKPEIYGEKLTVKRFSRVMQSERRKAHA